MNESKTKRGTKPTPDLVSANHIARELRRSARAIIEKINALELKPDAMAGERKLYRRGTIETIKKAMRAPNKRTSNHS